MKRVLLVFITTSLLLFSFTLLVSAEQYVIFQPTGVYVNDDNKVVVQGKFWNYGETPCIVDNEKIEIVYSSADNQTFKGTVECKELGIQLNVDQVMKYAFVCPGLQPIKIDKWNANTSTSAH